ncbi:protein of unknown function (plasmid) [Rhodovastum atsumiense]|nr:protein of unknown function [Rhodovastum atsumiense]
MTAIAALCSCTLSHARGRSCLAAPLSRALIRPLDIDRLLIGGLNFPGESVVAVLSLVVGVKLEPDGVDTDHVVHAILIAVYDDYIFGENICSLPTC